LHSFNVFDKQLQMDMGDLSARRSKVTKPQLCSLILSVGSKLICGTTIFWMVTYLASLHL